jgi:DNA-binding CsgD family transcriptional regulator
MSSLDPLVALNEKIDTLIKIQAALAVKGMATQREKIVFLYGAGLGPSFIAALLGTTPKTVSVTMANHKKAASARKESNDE